MLVGIMVEWDTKISHGRNDKRQQKKHIEIVIVTIEHDQFFVQ